MTFDDADYGLYDGVPPHQENPTSVRAALEILPHVGKLQLRVYKLIHQAGESGLTDDEIERWSGLSHQCASARRRELVLKGLVRDSGMVRRTSHKRLASVWIVGIDVITPGKGQAVEVPDGVEIWAFLQALSAMVPIGYEPSPSFLKVQRWLWALAK